MLGNLDQLHQRGRELERQGVFSERSGQEGRHNGELGWVNRAFQFDAGGGQAIQGRIQMRPVGANLNRPDRALLLRRFGETKERAEPFTT